MLFPYKYVPHQMEKMQEFIDLIFYEVWCKAPIGLDFDPDLFESEPDLKEIFSYFGFGANAPIRGKQFYKDVKGIYDLFATLNPRQIDQFRVWYQANNDIEKACKNNPNLYLARYADIAPIHANLCGQLAAFFKGLHSQELLNLSMLRDKIGDIDDHYQNFMRENCVGKCPFCGIADMHSIYHSKREAYDHYLPKSLYPFNSINFKNLVPACHHCNSTYKSIQDPAYTPKDPTRAVTRRKVFYPYTNHGYHIAIQIELKKVDVEHLTPNDIEFEFGPAALREELETWKDVYSIEERYKAKCCSKNDGKYWLSQAFDEWPGYGRSPADYLQTLTKQTNRNPFADSNFLKKAFLEGCDRAGLFSQNRDGAGKEYQPPCINNTAELSETISTFPHDGVQESVQTLSRAQEGAGEEED